MTAQRIRDAIRYLTGAGTVGVGGWLFADLLRLPPQLGSQWSLTDFSLWPSIISADVLLVGALILGVLLLMSRRERHAWELLAILVCDGVALYGFVLLRRSLVSLSMSCPHCSGPAL